MNRRKFLTAASLTGLAAVSLPRITSAHDVSSGPGLKGLVIKTTRLTAPKEGIPVAMLISSGVNVIDLSGPWGVFESVMIGNGGHETHQMPFKLFTVSDTTEIVTSGSGLKVKPDYTFANMPAPKVVVIPAQRGSDAMIEWLRQSALKADVTMSVCTGAFKLAKAGLLSGKAATTHHEFLDKLAQEFPDIDVRRDVRFVEGEKISTAAGLTSGTDLALRVVERYFGREVAKNAATYMEYQGQGWIV